MSVRVSRLRVILRRASRKIRSALSGRLIEPLTLFGQHQTPLDPAEQPDPEGLFQSLDLLTDR